MDGGGKGVVCPFIRQELCKYIGSVISEVTYEKKGHKLWSDIPKYFCKKPTTKL